MDNSQNYSSLSCEINIIRARNIEQRSSGSSLFVRCYLSSGKNQRVQIKTQEISSKSELLWDESFSLDCSGNQDSINMLKQGSVVLELHSRKITPVLGKLVGGSQILGRAEIPWRSVFESPNMEIVEWVIMCTSKKKHMHENEKPMAVQISMKVSVKEMQEVKKNDRLVKRSWDNKCPCMDYCGCNSSNIFSPDDYELFAVGTALDVL